MTEMGAQWAFDDVTSANRVAKFPLGQHNYRVNVTGSERGERNGWP